jgi:hypothetical protein
LLSILPHVRQPYQLTKIIGLIVDAGTRQASLEYLHTDR